MKPKTQNYTYLYFLGTSFLLLVYALVSLVMYGDSTIILPLFGNNIPVNHFQITIFFKIAYLVLALAYFIAQKLKFSLIPLLTYIHTYITIGAVAVNGILALFPIPPYLFTILSSWLVILGLAAQPLFLINLGIGISRRKKYSITG